MKSIQMFVAIFAMLFTVQTSTAQNYVNDFSWVNGPSNTNMTGAASCGSQNTITLTSNPSQHTLIGTSAIFPAVTGTDPTNVITIQLDFSTPVCNLRLKVNDIDQGAGTVPAETVVTSPAFDAISPSILPPGPLFTAGGATLFPGGLNNTLGWVEFNGPLTTVTLTYNRSIGYGLMLDSIMYECCENCICDSKDNKLIDASNSIPNSGAASVDVNLSSAGVPISTLNVSLPYYTSLADPDCIKCDPANISSYGKITNLPMIAGVSPTAIGSSSDGAAEIVYKFSTPTVINETISLDLQFPPTLDLSCCPNRVDYCIKLGMIDANCRICEKLLCLGTSSTGSTGSNGSSSKNNTKPSYLNPNKADQIGEESSLNNHNLKLILHPNPAQESLNITLPSTESATLEVFDLNGKLLQSKNVQKERIQLDVSELSQGTYILKYSLDETIITNKFVKQ